MGKGELTPSVEKYLRSNLSKGKLPTVSKLMKAAKGAGESLNKSDAEQWVKFYADIAQLATKRITPKVFQTQSVATYGLIFIDLAMFRPKFKALNRGAIGFIAAVEATTQQVASFPMRGKRTKDWRRAIDQVLDESVFGVVRTLVSDQEPAIVSRHFRNKLLAERGVRMVFLSQRHKAYAAEGYIRWLKNALVKAEAMRKRTPTLDHRKWTEVLPNIVTSFNQRKARNTSYKRKDIDEKNFDDFLGELFGTTDASLLMNSGTLDIGRAFSPKWTNRLFRFEQGERVLVARRAEKLGGAFQKPSVHGGFSPKVRIVAQRLMKRTRDRHNLLVPG